jgi:hypothetical protein
MAKKVKGFEDFNIEGEKEKLQKIKRSFKPNSNQTNEGIFSDEGHAGMNGERYIDEKSYNEEEVLELLVKMNEWPTTFDGEDEVREWFEEFKK